MLGLNRIRLIGSLSMFRKIFPREFLQSGFNHPGSMEDGHVGLWFVRRHRAVIPRRCKCCKKFVWLKIVIADYMDVAYGAHPRRAGTYLPKHAVREKLAGRKL